MSEHDVIIDNQQVFSPPWIALCRCGWRVRFYTKRSVMKYGQQHLDETADAESHAEPAASEGVS